MPLLPSIFSSHKKHKKTQKAEKQYFLRLFVFFVAKLNMHT